MSVALRVPGSLRERVRRLLRRISDLWKRRAPVLASASGSGPSATMPAADVTITQAVFADRPHAAQRFLEQVRAAAALQPNPFLERVTAVTDAEALQRQEERALSYIRRQVLECLTVDAEGTISEAGLPAVVRAYMHLAAIAERREELAREQAGQR